MSQGKSRRRPARCLRPTVNDDLMEIVVDTDARVLHAEETTGVWDFRR